MCVRVCGPDLGEFNKYSNVVLGCVMLLLLSDGCALPNDMVRACVLDRAQLRSLQALLTKLDAHSRKVCMYVCVYELSVFPPSLSTCIMSYLSISSLQNAASGLILKRMCVLSCV